LKSERVTPPELILKAGGDLPLSGSALLELMQAVLAKDVPVRFRACGWSMVPFIQDGDVITVAPLENQRPRLGEVVAFIHPENNKLVVHRVVAVKGDAFFIQGDSDHTFPDGFVSEENLIGSVTHLLRDGKRVRLGLGPERVLIAYLSRKGWLRPLRAKMAMLQKLFSRNRT
jgi:hypothetical protein